VLSTRIVLAGGDGATNVPIARDVAVSVDTVSTWRRRFGEHGLDGLRDLPRSGRPRTFDATVVAEIRAMACELPADSDTPLAKWSCPHLAAEAVNRGIVGSVSASIVRRWLASDAIKPWQHRSWIFPRDPDFAAKAAHVFEKRYNDAAHPFDSRFDRTDLHRLVDRIAA
jgi:transposase